MARPALLDITHAFTKNSGLCICCEVFVVRVASPKRSAHPRGLLTQRKSLPMGSAHPRGVSTQGEYLRKGSAHLEIF